MNRFRDFFDFFKEISFFFGMLAIITAAFVALGVGLYTVYQLSISPEEKAKQKQQEVYESTPHVYSKVDGCTVYTWRNGGRNHYFTTCENSNKVVTKSEHTEYCGKACNRTVTETIETNK